MRSRIRNIQSSLTAAQNNNDFLFYTPSSTQDGVELDGYFLDFFLNVRLTSIDPIPYIAPPAGLGMMTEAEKIEYFDKSTQNAPKKILSIYQQVGLGPLLLMTELTIFRDNPSYQEDLFPFLTRTNRIGIAYGTKVFLKVRDFGSGLLGTGDELIFRAVVLEEATVDVDMLAKKYLLGET